MYNDHVNVYHNKTYSLKQTFSLHIQYMFCKSPVTPERRPRSFQKVADGRSVRCAVARNAVETL